MPEFSQAGEAEFEVRGIVIRDEKLQSFPSFGKCGPFVFRHRRLPLLMFSKRGCGAVCPLIRSQYMP